MQITSTLKPPTLPLKTRVSPPSLEFKADTSEPRDGWVGTTLSVLGGVAALAGAVSYQPLLAAGGALSTALGTAMTAARVQKSGMDSAAWVSFGVGGGLTALSALTMMAPPTQHIGPQGPLPTFLRQMGIQAL